MSDRLELTELEDRLAELEEAQETLTNFAGEKHRGRTAAKLRDENGYELADDDDSNMADVAAIEAFDEEDYESEQAIDQKLGRLGGNLEVCDEGTGQTALRALGDELDDAKADVIERAR